MTTPTRGARALKRIPARQRSDSDAVEVALATSGDTRAFERLYRSHVGRIHALTRRMLSPDEADDATQDVFIRAWQKLESFRGESAFGTWLHKIAVNVCLGRRAQLGQARARYHADDAPLETVAHPHTGGALDRVDFETALERLPDGARQVFVLHDVEGYRHEEIAEMLGTVTGTSKSQLHRARMALRQHLER
ncbi:MAG TPA: RNA polymerase sigma factor [Gemmatimonadales bacterium]|nr:RNA polymerase sigma factor [Gemmatimonadales bacterium]